jgi:N-acetylglucosaminyl-diphospho-decaprenol L-rhamnosyltransferase
LTDVSVSIVNTNNREFLLSCLDSLCANITGDVSVEIVVLDNASEDGSATAVRTRFPDVHVIAQERRAGFGANHNTVIHATDGRYVYVLNEDTTSVDWGFAKMVEEMDALPRAAALGPRLVYPDGRHQRSAWRFPTPVISLFGLPTLGKVGINQSRGTRPRSVDWVAGAALLLRREALEGVGLFDEDFFIYFEEVDLCFRLRRAGWDVRYFPGVTVVHHESQSSADIPERRINEMWRGRRRYWCKHHSAIGFRIAALATGGQYLGAAAASAVRRDSARRRTMGLHARNAVRSAGPGLQELADEWNRAADRASVECG